MLFVLRISLHVLCQILRDVGRVIRCMLDNSENKRISLENLDILEDSLHHREIGDSAEWLEFRLNCIIKPEALTDLWSLLLHTLQLCKKTK